MIEIMKKMTDFFDSFPFLKKLVIRKHEDNLF